MVAKKNIIGIFDMDSTTVDETTRDYLTAAQQSGEVADVCENLPKSFIVCVDTGKKNHRSDRRTHRQKVVISPLASTTLRKRSGEAMAE